MYEISGIKENEKNGKKCLTNGKGGGNISKLSARAASKIPQLQKILKVLKKRLDKIKEMWYSE